MGKMLQTNFMLLSVIIPTFNNSKILPECLRRIFDQTLSREEYEIIVVNDASTDETVNVLSQFNDRVKVINLEKNSGSAASRNAGIKASNSKLEVFIQDDIFVEPDFLEHHLKFHKDHANQKDVLIGLTVFDPAIGITPFMRWLESGHQFKFPHSTIQQFNNLTIEITDKPFLTFYTPNLSLKKSLVEEVGGFDETLFIKGGVVYDDTELGYRLYKADMRLFFDPGIKVFHHHFKSLESVCRLRRASGQVAKLLYEKHPELRKVFKDDLKTRVSRILVNKVSMTVLEPLAKWSEARICFDLLYWLVCRYYYNLGYVE